MKLKLFLVSLCFSLFSYAGGEHQHHVSLFTGATESHKVSYGTVGLEYQYLINEDWGAGVLYETIQTSPSTNVGMVFGSYQVIEYLNVVLGVGQETVSGHSESLTRIGLNYSLHLGEFTVAPSLNYDSISGGHSAVVYGLLWGMGF